MVQIEKKALEDLRRTVVALKKVIEKQQEEKLIFCLKYKQIHLKLMEKKNNLVDSECQTDLNFDFASAIKFHGQSPSFLANSKFLQDDAIFQYVQTTLKKNNNHNNIHQNSNLQLNFEESENSLRTPHDPSKINFY